MCEITKQRKYFTLTNIIDINYKNFIAIFVRSKQIPQRLTIKNFNKREIFQRKIYQTEIINKRNIFQWK